MGCYWMKIRLIRLKREIKEYQWGKAAVIGDGMKQPVLTHTDLGGSDPHSRRNLHTRVLHHKHRLRISIRLLETGFGTS